MDLENITNEINHYDHYDDILWPTYVRLCKTYIRDAQNPFEAETEGFKKRYRFQQESVLYIVSIIKNDLVKENNRGLPIAPEIAVLLTLRFYATASFQIVCGDLLQLSQPTASNIITKVSKLLAGLIARFVKFPRGEEASTNRQSFMQLGRHGRWPGLPGVDGAIDCTHIKLVNTPGCQHHEAFRNRKSYFSINVQAVVGPNTEFLDIVAKWAGSVHDSRIFRMSTVHLKYSQGHLRGRLVGDSGYPSLPFVLTPVRPSPVDPPSIRYNRAQVKTRVIVERTFGIWKRRFPCLSRGLGNKLTTVSNIIVACAVLHNLSLLLNDGIPIDEGESLVLVEQDDDFTNTAGTSSGLALRTSLIENLYQ